MNTQIIKSYRNQDTLRHSFNALAGKTFEGLNFEPWYQNGYWSDSYNPYSIIVDGEIIANVSVNLIDFMWNGEKKHLIQLGTVMTDERFRNQGLIRRIMHEIDSEYSRRVDGIYLFANDSVLNFYPKFGFRQAMEYRYSKPFSTSRKRTVVQIPMKEKEDWLSLEAAMGQSVSYSRFSMAGNSNLIMFYITGFMQDCVYYDKQYDAYIIAETDGDTLVVHDIFSKEKYPVDDILASFGPETRQVILGFTPTDTQSYMISPFRKEDCTLFVKDSVFDGFDQERLIFPTLSHA